MDILGEEEGHTQEELLCEMNEILNSNDKKRGKTKISKFTNYLKNISNEEKIQLFINSINNNYISIFKMLLKDKEIESYISKENLEKNKEINKEIYNVISTKPKIIYILLENNNYLGEYFLNNSLDNNENIKTLKEIFSLEQDNKIYEFFIKYILNRPDKINYIIRNDLYEINDDDFIKDLVVKGIFSDPKLFEKIFKSNLKFKDFCFDNRILQSLCFDFMLSEEKSNAIENFQILLKNIELDLPQGSNEIRYFFLNSLSSVSNNHEIVALGNFMFEKYDFMKNLKNDDYSIINESINESKFEIFAYLIEKTDLNLNLLDINSKEILIQNYINGSFENTILQKIKNRITLDLFNCSPKNEIPIVNEKQQYVYTIEDLKDGKQGGNQVKYNKIYKYDEIDNSIKLKNEIAFAKITGKNNANMLYEVTYNNNKQIITFYKKGTNEENKENNTLIVAEIDENNKLKFNFSEENLNNELFLKNLKKDIKEVTSINYKSVNGFDFILSYLEYLPLLYKDKDLDIIVECKGLERITEQIKDVLVAEEDDKIRICDFGYKGHNTQLLISKDEIIIFNTGDIVSSITFKTNINDIYKKNNIDKLTGKNNLNIKCFKTLEQKSGNCVKMSKEFITTFILKYYKYNKKEEKLSNVMKKLDRFLKISNDFLQIEKESEELKYFLKLNEEEFKNISILKEIIKKTNKSIIKNKNNNIEVEKSMENVIDEFEKAEKIKKSIENNVRLH